jgi:tRNA-Thr(GGU) m(6)t(6)A37 methyltransferase TsaA
MDHQVTYSPIGIIRSPFKELKGTPIQPIGAKGIKGWVEIHEEFVAGLKDLEGFSHIFLIYHFHLSKGYSLEVKPFLDKSPHGVFATRATNRPNPIGLSVVRLIGIKGAVLEIEDLDVVDGTPLLDIKPYVPELDCRPADRIGWLTGKVQAARESRADERFK